MDSKKFGTFANLNIRVFFAEVVIGTLIRLFRLLLIALFGPEQGFAMVGVGGRLLLTLLTLTLRLRFFVTLFNNSIGKTLFCPSALNVLENTYSIADVGGCAVFYVFFQ